MAAISIPMIGEQFVGHNPGVLKVAKVSAGFDSTNDVVLTATGTYPLANIKAGVAILEIRTVVNTAFTATTTLTIGDGDDPDGLIASAAIAPQTAVSTGILVKGAGAYAGGHEYAADDTIDIVVGTAAVDAGQLDVYFFYFDNEVQL